MVGRFNKASPGLSADFNSCPIFEGTWDECVLFLQNHLRSTCLTIINELTIDQTMLVIDNMLKKLSVDQLADRLDALRML